MRSLSLFIVLLNVVLNCAQAQIAWQKDTLNPTIPSWSGDGNTPNGFRYSFAPGIFFNPYEKIYRMWFTSLATNGNVFCISEALSLDGDTWFVNSKNPVLKPGGSDAAGLIYPCVIKDANGYKMYFSMNWTRLEIGVATSPDGVKWTKYPGNPVIHGGSSGSWNYTLRDPAVIFDNGVYKMWFEGRNGYPSSLGYATSLDGFNWSLYSGNPIIEHGAPGSFEEMGVGEPTVIKVGNVYHMIYTGYTNQLLGRLGYAYSYDGINWTRFQGNPVIGLGRPGDWDEAHVASGTLLFEGNQFHLWYSGTSNGVHQTGHATSTPASLTDFSTLASDKQGLPKALAITNNFPNPFNPSTTILYTLPSKGTAQLKIFDLLGSEVVTLVNTMEEPGEHRVMWDGRRKDNLPVASGTYIARLLFYDDSGSQQTFTQKLLLTK